MQIIQLHSDCNICDSLSVLIVVLMPVLFWFLFLIFWNELIFSLSLFRYYEGLQKCVGLFSENGLYSPDEIDRLDALYKSLGQEYRWSSAVKVYSPLMLPHGSFTFLTFFCLENFYAAWCAGNVKKMFSRTN